MFMPTDQPRNPWLTHLTYMAVGKPNGEDLAHDSLRLGLLSLASFDIGFKMQSALQNPHDNAMYANSMAQRESAVASLQTGFLLGMFSNDMVSADLALGTVLCIAIHDVSICRRRADSSDSPVVLNGKSHCASACQSSKATVVRQRTSGQHPPQLGASWWSRWLAWSCWVGAGLNSSDLRVSDILVCTAIAALGLILDLARCNW